MSNIALTPSRRPPLHLFIALCLGVPCCNTGTEGDNPFVGPVDASPCKGESEYANYLARPSVSPSLGGGALEPEYGSVEQPLVARNEMPIGLECLEWEYSGETLQLGVSNFEAGCGIDWEGETRVPEPGEIVVDLRNPSCDIARCGSCAYDSNAALTLARSDLLVEGSDAAHVTLQLRDCKGELQQVYEWDISIADSGIRCRPIEAWSWLYGKVSDSDFFSETQLNLYAQCGDVDGAVECTEDRSCNAGYCVPACTVDADCPLGGALSCRDGACLVEM